MKWILFCVGFLLFAAPSYGQEATNSAIPNGNGTYFRGEVIKVLDEGKTIDVGYTNYFQRLGILVENGDDDFELVLEHGGVSELTPDSRFQVGDEVVLIKFGEGDSAQFSILDRYRLPPLLWMLGAFFVFVILVAGKRGVGSIVGLVLSFVVIVYFLVPQILSGRDPVLIAVLSALFIMVSTMYLAHSISYKTTIAVVSTFITLVITGVLSYVFVEVSALSGIGSEESFYLQFGPNFINLKGLLLGGMIIGALGVLDDITTSQTSAVFEIYKANKGTNFKKLFLSAMNVGRDHVASLVNTLVLAYAGASIALFLLFVSNPANQPYWVILNSEAISEEIVRTVSGSFGLVLAVPITSVLSAFWVSRVSK